MDYEKLYKKALERASKLRFQNPFDTVSQMVEYIFPELKESEDERIRKMIINHLTQERGSLSNEDTADAIKWLEKQGESKYIPKYKIGDYVKNTNYKGEPIYEIIYMDKECYICEYRGKEKMGDKTVMHFSFDNPYLRLVQKPVDKAEPKFHEGDWVVDNNGKVAIIYDLQKAGYVGHYTNGTDFVCKYGNEHLLHLWTIQDAKDGDVLYSPSHHLIWIYKDNEHYHASINLNYANVVSFDNEIVVPSDVCPANRVQRSILFQKMEESNYKWDADKKELRKIEQKSKWTDEDEKRLQSCIIALQGKGLMGGVDTMDSKWLKSLKQRVG